jgi:hypothetical protein
MSLLSVGIQDIKICLLSVTVHTISWNKTPVWSAATQSKTQPGQSTSTPLSQESCVWISTPSTQHSWPWVATTVQSWFSISE